MSLNPKQKNIIKELFREFKPKTKKNGLDFAKEYGYLSAESSAVVGRFVPFPYQEEILNATTDDSVELLVWLKSTRTGYTKIVNFSVAYNIVEDPAPQLIFQPVDGKANEWSKKELKPLLRDMPIIGDRILKTREDNNLNYKAYPGGFVESRGGKSASNYASATVKKVVFDEYDRFPDDVDGEGDPYSLGKKRTESYWNGIVIIGSTPTIKGQSKTEAKFEETDKRYRFVPCPKCNYMQVIKFQNLVWEKEYREGVKTHLTHTTKLKCVNCETLIDHKEKKQMDIKGEWRQTQAFYCCETWQDPLQNRTWKNGEAICRLCGDTAEYNKLERKKRGYHIWAGYSIQPNTTWETIAETFVQAIGSVEKMKSFYNTWLGESFEEKSVKIESNSLRERAEDYTMVPNDAKIILMTVDTQNDRFEYLITAWADGETSYNLESGIVWGDPINKSVRDELRAVADKELQTEDGRTVSIYKAFIDMGGQRTDEVKHLINENRDKFIMLKGDSNESKQNINRPIALLKKMQKEDEVIMWVATTKAKDIIFERLSLQPHEYGYIHHNKSFSNEWYDQLTAEKKVFKKNRRGYIEESYIKIRDRNEALDLVVYQLAAIKLLQNQIKGFSLSVKE